MLRRAYNSFREKSCLTSINFLGFKLNSRTNEQLDKTDAFLSRKKMQFHLIDEIRNIGFQKNMAALSERSRY